MNAAESKTTMGPLCELPVPVQYRIMEAVKDLIANPEALCPRCGGEIGYIWLTPIQRPDLVKRPICRACAKSAGIETTYQWENRHETNSK